MIIDKELQFCDGQAITDDAASENTIDFKGADIGRGEPVPISIVVTEDFDNLDDLTVAVQDSEDDGDSDDYADVIKSAPVPRDDLEAGYEFILTVMPEKMKRYGRLYFTISGSSPSAGKITANVVADRQTNY